MKIIRLDQHTSIFMVGLTLPGLGVLPGSDCLGLEATYCSSTRALRVELSVHSVPGSLVLFCLSNWGFLDVVTFVSDLSVTKELRSRYVPTRRLLCYWCSVTSECLVTQRIYCSS